ncbi:hypothetical protein FLA_5061 [Filimonas lacunae]|nr:hypothetical protein FLA_5061 [Filimonas lacunae]
MIGSKVEKATGYLSSKNDQWPKARAVGTERDEIYYFYQ